MNFCECCNVISEVEKWCFEFDIKANELGEAFMFQRTFWDSAIFLISAKPVVENPLEMTSYIANSDLISLLTHKSDLKPY